MNADGPVLFVEDDPNDAMLMLAALDEAAIRRPIVSAADGEQACRLLDDERFVPALVILDLNLPKVSGLEVLEHIRCDKRLSRLRVAVLTSSDEPRDRARALALRADAYLLKPLSLDGYSAITDALRRLLP